MLIFHCPACGTRLQLPVTMAGISGPCPNCATPIQSPTIPAPVPPTTAPVAAQEPVTERPAALPLAPRMPSYPTKPRPSPRNIPATSPPSATPVSIQPRESARPSPIPPDRLVRPNNSAATPIRPGHAPEPQYRPRQARRSRILSWGIPAGFIIACIALFTGLLLVLGPKPEVDAPAEMVDSSVGRSSDTELWPIRIGSELAHQPQRQAAAASPPTGPIPAPSGELHPADLAARATSIVQDFLDATSLEERRPLIISRRPPGELAGTSLAGRLPNHLVPELERQITLPRELLTEFYFTATFPGAPAPNPRVISILVRQRGSDDPPKVLADPFIDLFDGAVREFGAEPFDGSRTFHVLAEPIPICSDLAVPDPDQRITLRLRPHEHGKELASAYTRKVSKIGEMLNEPRSALRWGQAHPCIVTVQWNRDIPEQPFLELLSLDALTWNH